MNMQLNPKPMLPFIHSVKLLAEQREWSLFLIFLCALLALALTPDAPVAKATNNDNMLRGEISIVPSLRSIIRSVQHISGTVLQQLSHRAINQAEIRAYSLSPASITISKCPIQITQLLPIRGFKLGESLAEFSEHFQGGHLSIPEPDYLGIRSMKFYWPQEGRRLTDINEMEFRFFDDRLYQIEAVYAVGTEWEERPLSEFASVISRGLGVEAGWTEATGNRFKLDCGEVRFDLWVMKPIMSRSSLPAGQMATAYLTLTATSSEAQIRKREETLRQQQQQRDAERRRVFRP
jgi:hypothetical protein